MRNAVSVIAAVIAALPLFLYVLLSVSELDSHGSLILLLNIAAAGAAGANIMVGSRIHSSRAFALAPHFACGALLGAAFVGPLAIASYALLASLAFGILAFERRAEPRRKTTISVAWVLAATLLNAAFLWPFTLGIHRPGGEETYLSLDLRVHTLLRDTPPHDVWTVHLHGNGENGNLRDLDEALMSYGFVNGNDRLALVLVFGVYFLVSKAFGWHDDACAHTDASIRRRLTEVDLIESASPPVRGPFLYKFDSEAAIEIQTCVGHAVYAYAMTPSENGHLLYWAAYSLPVGWLTPLYLATIDPVRRLVVFPSLLERIERAWRKRWDQ